MLLAKDNPLAGGTPRSTMDNVKTRFIRVVRAFYWQREVAPVGAVLELPAIAASEFVASNKAAYCEPPKATLAVSEDPPKSRPARKE